MAPEALDLADLQPEGAGRSMLSNLTKALAAKVAKGRALAREKIMAQVTEKQALANGAGDSRSPTKVETKPSKKTSKQTRSPKLPRPPSKAKAKQKREE